jgi:hypothetical protein
MAGTATDILFKVSFKLKDGLDCLKFADTVDKMLECYDVTCERKLHCSCIEFFTSVHENYAGIWGTIIDILESKMLPYLEKVQWHNYETKNEEDVLEELAEED